MFQHKLGNKKIRCTSITILEHYPLTGNKHFSYHNNQRPVRWKKTTMLKTLQRLGVRKHVNTWYT